MASRANVLHLHNGKQCNPGRIAKSLLVGSAPKPLKTRAYALWLCRIPASSDFLAALEIKKKKSPCASYHAANAETAMNKYEALKRMHHQYACDQKASVFIFHLILFFLLCLLITHPAGFQELSRLRVKNDLCFFCTIHREHCSNILRFRFSLFK